MRYKVESLGEAKWESPLQLSTHAGDAIADYSPDGTFIKLEAATKDGMDAFELAGPREKVFFQPANVRVGIVTCGGLCPGINNVVRALVLRLWYNYGVRMIYGFRYGLNGLSANPWSEPLSMLPVHVSHIHRLGGTMLGTSRGPIPEAQARATLHQYGINVLFLIGGDGTMRAASRLHMELSASRERIALIGIPKTIDNDIPFVSRSFGFQTAVEVAAQAIAAAHVEADSVPYGIGLVRLMGRDAGFIASAATLACHEVNLVLIPELSFDLASVVQYLRHRLLTRRHAVVVVAEGAGQSVIADKYRKTGTDASGNPKLNDIGAFLRDNLPALLDVPSLTLKYIDPSYMIRAAAANSVDAMYCSELAEAAVHAAMAGKTGMMIGQVHDQLVHVPLSALAGQKKRVPLDGSLWRSVVASTGQPSTLLQPQDPSGDARPAGATTA